MDTASPPIHPAAPDLPETEADRNRRFAWEANGIAEADAELDAGLYVDAADMKSWISSIGTDHERPPPPTRHR